MSKGWDIENLSSTQLAQLKAKFSGKKVAIIGAEWNKTYTQKMVKDAYETLVKILGEENVDLFKVPGSVELVYAAKKLATLENINISKPVYDAIIAIGCVIKGETAHFEYVSQFVTNGLMEINANPQIKVPVIFGVLTTYNMVQAADRAETKGKEYAIAALRMIEFNNIKTLSYSYREEIKEFWEI